MPRADVTGPDAAGLPPNLDPYPFPGHNVQRPLLGYGRGLDPAYPTYRRYPRSVGYFGATYGRPFYPAYDHPGTFYFGAALRLNF